MNENPTILIVDDDERLIELYIAFLQGFDYRILHTTDPAEGLRMAAEFTPDLIISDVVMSGIDGLELLQEIKKRRIPTRVMLTTGLAKEPHETVSFAMAGACDVLHKPMSRSTFLSRISRALAIAPTLDVEVSGPDKSVWYNAESVTKELEMVRKDLAAANQRVRELETELADRSDKDRRFELIGRAANLFMAVLVTVILARLQLVPNAIALLWMPAILFVLLCLPFQRIQNFVAKIWKSETRATFKK
jgi:DNA-binding response OmpR family regulator